MFWLCILLGRIEGQAGVQLWDSDQPEGIHCRLNVSKYLPYHHFKKIKTKMSLLSANESMKGEDKWWKIQHGINLFNQKSKTNCIYWYCESDG